MTSIRFFVLTMLSLPFLLNYAQAEDLKAYYPIQDGNSWTYETTNKGDKYLEEWKIVGREEIPLPKDNIDSLEVIRLAKTSKNEHSYDFLIVDPEGVKYIGDQQEGKDPEIVSLADAIMRFAFDIENIKTYKKDYLYFENNEDGSEAAIEKTREINFAGWEDIEVPAGKFERCLKLSRAVVTRELGKEPFEKLEELYWFAKDVGMVKKVKKTDGIEYDLKRAFVDGKGLIRKE